MSNVIEVGTIVTGKVTAIKPFGAFVALEEGKEGLVHISQIAHTYVKDINEHVKVGDEVQVKILSIDEKSGRISLSIRETQPAPQQESRPPKKRANRTRTETNYRDPQDSEGFNSLGDKLKVWLEQSKES